MEESSRATAHVPHCGTYPFPSPSFQTHRLLDSASPIAIDIQQPIGSCGLMNIRQHLPEEDLCLFFSSLGSYNLLGNEVSVLDRLLCRRKNSVHDGLHLVQNEFEREVIIDDVMNGQLCTASRSGSISEFVHSHQRSAG